MPKLLSRIISVSVLLWALWSFAIAMAPVAAIPAGCPGGPIGPPAPGTNCSTGSTRGARCFVPQFAPGAPLGEVDCTKIKIANPELLQGTLGNGNCFAPDPNVDNSQAYTMRQVDCNNPSQASGISRADIGNSCSNGNDPCGLYSKYFAPAVKFLSAGVGIIVVMMIVVGGIQYASAGGDPGKVAAAKSRIYNAIYALLAYLVLFAFLQWVVPGGII